MNKTYCAGLAYISVVCSQAFAAGPDPATANAATPRTNYLSPFADYRPLGEDKNTPWKDANDTVGKNGGWRAYAREAAEAMKALRTPDTVKPAPNASALPKPAAAAPMTSPPPSHKHGG